MSPPYRLPSIMPPQCTKPPLAGLQRLVILCHSNSKVCLLFLTKIRHFSDVASGSSVALYGMAVFNSTSLQNITADYTIDGVTRPWSIPNDTISYLPMLELFRADVDPGNHTLLFNLTSITGNRSLAIDFIAYNASYSTITAQPFQALSKTTSNWRPKVGIAVGVIAGFTLLLVLGLFFWKKSRLPRHQGKQYASHS